IPIEYYSKELFIPIGDGVRKIKTGDKEEYVKRVWFTLKQNSVVQSKETKLSFSSTPTGPALAWKIKEVGTDQEMQDGKVTVSNSKIYYVDIPVSVFKNTETYPLYAKVTLTYDNVDDTQEQIAATQKIILVKRVMFDLNIL
ncbi:MAG: hypothetical protein PHY48_15830, partial [Candidatus Cloacimonetes bacterium]|nr:hypothetical protein [Candidatus Cloacimonadota bacterium]